MLTKYNNNESITRTGIILYTYNPRQPKNIQFLMGIDQNSRDLCDFGGGRKTNENVLESALRELSEETRGIFGSEITTETIRKSSILTNKVNEIIFFVYVDPKWIDIAEHKFMEAKNNGIDTELCYNELSGLVWIDAEEFYRLFNSKGNRRIWSKLGKFIKYNTTRDQLEALSVVR